MTAMAKPLTGIGHDPIPFTPTEGPNGWCLDLVPLPYVGQAASALWDVMNAVLSGKHDAKVSTQDRPHAMKITRKGWSIWIWNDGSLMARKAKHDPLPFPMFLHPKGTTYPHQPRGLPLLDPDWLVARMGEVMDAWIAHDSKVAADGSVWVDYMAQTIGADPDDGALPPEAARPCLLWWVPLRGPNPAAWTRLANRHNIHALLRDRDALHAYWQDAIGRVVAAASARIAIFAPHARPVTHKAFVDLGGAMPTPQGAIVPGTINGTSLRGLHPDIDAFLRRAMDPLLAQDLALCTAWSVDVQPADGTMMALPKLVGAPLLPTQMFDMPPPTAHAMLEAQAAIEAEMAQDQAKA